LSFRYRIEAGDPTASAAEHGLALFRQGRLDRAIPFLWQGAAQGEARAQYVLATALFNGDEVERDVVAAFRWMSAARDAGLAQAAESLAEMERLAPEHVGVSAPGDRALLSCAALDICRRLMAEHLPPTASEDTGSLAEMVRALAATELRARLDQLIPEALARGLAARV
jgi:TPR repeat protein